jgi:predicted Rossmann fold flavoprotein
VVGGGASGMMAAIVAAQHGAQVTLCERLDRVGRKLLATGNGRCNLTNIRCEQSHFHGGDPGFAMTVVNQLPPQKTLEFFERLGLICAVEEEGRVYPMSGQASAVLDTLRFEAARRGVAVQPESAIVKITQTKARFRVSISGGRAFAADRVVVAAGGKAAPNLGSNGSGYALLESLGHRLTPTFPALVQLNLAGPWLRHLDGVRTHGTIAVSDGERELRSDRGELQFTSYGISGIPVLQVSRTASERLVRGRETFVDIGLCDNLTYDRIKAIIDDRVSSDPAMPLDQCLIGFLHKKIIPAILSSATDHPRKPCGEVTEEERRRIVAVLIRWRMVVTGTQPWTRAQVTAGGIDTSQIDPLSMESRIAPGLFVAGELVDVDGDCGGYNLQWAWSSGYIAGLHAAAGHP